VLKTFNVVTKKEKLESPNRGIPKTENMVCEVSEENKQMKRHIDKNRLANAVLKGKKKSKFDFALGHQMSGIIEDLMKTLHVEGVGEIPVPISTQVHMLLSINLIMSYFIMLVIV